MKPRSRRSRSLLLVAPAALAAVAAASALAAVAAASALAGTPAAQTAPASAAARDAASLLTRLTLPPGATALARPPAGVAIGPPPVVPATPDVVTREAYYMVPLPLHAVLAFIDAHRPRGSRPTTSGSSSSRGQPTSYFVAFSFTPTAALAQRTVGASLAAQSPSRTIVVAAADDVWLTVRPAAERIPATAKVATLTITPPLAPAGSRRASTRRIVVTASGKVARLTAAVDALPAAQPGLVSCPADDGATVSIAFAPTRGGAVLALARADLTGCGGVTFALRGHAGPPLTDGPSLGRAVQRILGIPVRAR